ncbi:PARP-like domain-containing protein [Colletotrichum truncatum]|uniref:PARP-like domain-containing protein n=1 Tax=Colletotrichum truncatum TaxID=5467 RepID=A0ACC3ZGL6_COLTU|nr:PARP-like domain-containing protein [Colletotrichum truncatum]KAF6790424.1 PARP-like domain-containing protein [Colletotrichum truncatum]
MPPRRSGRTAAAAAAAPAAPAAPAAQPLDGAVIAISGTFDKKHAEIESLLNSLGASISKSVTKKTTHLITTQEDFDAATTKVAAAQNNNLPIVSLEWAQECESKGSKVSEDDFAVGSQSKSQPKKTSRQKTPVAAPNGSSQNGASSQANASQQGASQSQPAAATKANGSRKKRTKDAAQSDNESDAPPEPKKKKAANGTKGKRVASAAPSDDADAKTDVKKDDDADIKTDVKKEATADSQAPKKQPLAEGQVAKTLSISIPLDEGCSIPGVVYIAPDGVIYDASLNQTNASNNNNKFYRIQLIQNGSKNGPTYKVWTRWGRVGEAGANAVLGDGELSEALKQFDKKFKDKSGLSWADRGKDPKPKKYAFIERSYEPDSDDDDDTAGDVKTKEEEPEEDKVSVACTLEKPVEELMGLIFNPGYFAQAMSSMNYDANKLPLGKLSKNTIVRGFQALKDLSALFSDRTLASSKYSMTPVEANEHLSNLYYTLIPHDFGRTRPPIISTPATLKKELDLLDSLSDMKVASDLMKADRKAVDVHPADKQFQSLGMDEMTALDHKSEEFTLLSDYLNGSKGSTHGVNYTVQEIFRIERNGELDRFKAANVRNTKTDRRLLWHGSRVTNFGGILSQGLRIAPPEAPVSGYMFGKGIYLADMSTKSAGYCASYNSGGEALLLLCEAELGDPIQKLIQSSYNAGDTAKANGMLSTWGQGRTGPSKWMDASCVNPSLKGIQMPDTSVTPGDTGVKNASLYYNEFIVYDVAQIRLRYLFRVKM